MRRQNKWQFKKKVHKCIVHVHWQSLSKCEPPYDLILVFQH
jgi:hypothetical protein